MTDLRAGRPVLRYVCTKHDSCDLICEELNSDGNPSNGLFMLPLPRRDEAPGVYDTQLGKLYGLADSDGNVLRPGTWYVPDHSDFYCPGQQPVPDDVSADQEEDLYCTKYWGVQVLIGDEVISFGGENA
jgi:hypothetical protein